MRVATLRLGESSTAVLTVRRLILAGSRRPLCSVVKVTVRPAHSICLMLAVWAVLFAPGAISDGGVTVSAGEVLSDRGHFGAAVIAPTFGVDDLAAVRPCDAGDRGTDVCDVVPGIVPALSAMALAAALSTAATHRVPTASPVQLSRAGSPRAPPIS